MNAKKKKIAQNADITEKLEKNPLLQFTIDPSLTYKNAKKLFKKQYFTKLLQLSYGNISKVAEDSNLDRRSVHRFIKELKINVDKIRKDVLNRLEKKISNIEELVFLEDTLVVVELWQHQYPTYPIILWGQAELYYEEICLKNNETEEYVVKEIYDYILDDYRQKLTEELAGLNDDKTT